MDTDHLLDRRRFLAGMATAVAGAQLGLMDLAQGQPRPTAQPPPGTQNASHALFDAAKQVDAGVLSVGYAEAGPPSGPVVILLHGWPYDIHSFADVAPLLASAERRASLPPRHFATASRLRWRVTSSP